jgi:hypothetical protein
MSVSFSSGVSIENGVRLVQPPAMISISSQPTNNTVNYGANGRFAVTAAITRGAPLSYQWQKQENSTGSWVNISGATTSSYNVASAVYPDDDNDSYRVVLTGGLNANTLTSNTATLSVTPSVITITNQSSLINTSANETNILTFSVNASITLGATLSYQWQRQDSGSATWNDVINGSFSSYTTGFLTNADDNGDSYRVRISGTKGATTVYSNTATITVNVVSQPDTFAVENYYNYYGAADGTQSYFNSGVTWGELTSDYVSLIAYYGGTDVGGRTVIELKDGTYDSFGSFTVTNGAIDGDGPGDMRTFNIMNTYYVFQYDGTDAYFRNYKNTDTLYLPDQVGYGRTGIWYNTMYQETISPGIKPDTVTLSGGMGGGTYYGFNVDYNDFQIFGYTNLQYDYFKRIVYDGTNTVIKMNPGQYDLGGSNTFIVQSNNAIGGDTTGSTRYFNIGGTNKTFTYSSSTGLYSKSGDEFGLYDAVAQGQTLTIVYDPSNQPAQGGGGSGGGSTVTYVADTDFDPGTNGPPGLSIGGQQGQYTITIFNSGWTNTTARDLILSKPSGTVFTAIIGGYTRTVTMTSGWTSFNGGAGSYASVTADEMLYGATTSITVPGAGGSSGGGGGTTVNFTLFGIWTDNGMVSFRVLATETADVALMDAIPSGATLTITDNAAPTITLTLNGGFTKSGPAGPPGYERYYYDAVVTTNNANFPADYGQITSISY